MSLEFSVRHVSEGDPVWISDPVDVYVPATVVSKSRTVVVLRMLDSGETVEIPVDSGSKTSGGGGGRARGGGKSGGSAAIEVLPRAESHSGPAVVDNMDDLTHLHSASILDNIRLRFDRDLIYTATGPILIAVNPFKWLSIYGAEVVRKYHESESPLAAPPHCFAVAEASLRVLAESGRSGSVIICGESGAGKTETTKLMLSYLSQVATPGGGDGVARRIMGSNPVMEAFGNAKTLRNNNSSRFGKFVRVSFTGRRLEDGGLGGASIAGATITNYLLEKSRVVARGAGERSYHAFYQLLAGASPEQRRQLHLGDATVADFSYLGAEAAAVEGMDDKELWEETVTAMEEVGMSAEARENVLRVTAAVLHLGNMMFVPASGAEGGGSKLDTTAPKSEAAANAAAALLGLSSEDLVAALTTREMRTPEGVIQRTLDPAQSGHARDALSKALYGRMFDGLIDHINLGLATSSSPTSSTSTSSSSSSPSLSSLPFIGILDIYGFENMEKNGFEQLFINYANEKLQNLFNATVFEAEARVYRDEGLDIGSIEFPDNQPCLDLIEKRSIHGILPMIDSECLLGARGSDSNLARSLLRQHADHPHFEPAGPSTRWRADGQSFVIHHYAGPILYRCEEFVEKNRDTLFASLESAMCTSGDAFVRSLFATTRDTGDAPLSPRTPGGGLQQTVAARFREEMQALHATVRVTDLRFVRCIKPTGLQRPGVFERRTVSDQLTYAGVMAALEMRRAGYPSRLLHAAFLSRFRAFLSAAGRRRLQLARRGEAELDLGFVKSHVMHVASHAAVRRAGITPDSVLAGHTQVFMRANVLPAMDTAHRRYVADMVASVQAMVRGVSARVGINNFRHAILRLQARSKGRTVRRVYALRIEAAQGRREVRTLQRAATGIVAAASSLRERAKTEKVLRRPAVQRALQKATVAAQQATSAANRAQDSLIAIHLDAADDGHVPVLLAEERAREGLVEQRAAIRAATDARVEAVEAEAEAETALQHGIRERQKEMQAARDALRALEKAREDAVHLLRNGPPDRRDTHAWTLPHPVNIALNSFSRPLDPTIPPPPHPQPTLKAAIEASRDAATHLAGLAAAGQVAPTDIAPSEESLDPSSILDRHAILEKSSTKPTQEQREDAEILGEEELQAAAREAAATAGDEEADGVVESALEACPPLPALSPLPPAVTDLGLQSSLNNARIALETTAAAVLSEEQRMLRAEEDEEGDGDDGGVEEGEGRGRGGDEVDGVGGSGVWREFPAACDAAVAATSLLSTVVETWLAFSEAQEKLVATVQRAVSVAEKSFRACSNAANLRAPGPGRVAQDPGVVRAMSIARGSLSRAQDLLQSAEAAMEEDGKQSSGEESLTWIRLMCDAHIAAVESQKQSFAIVAAAREERRRRVAADRARLKAHATVLELGRSVSAMAGTLTTLSTLPGHSEDTLESDSTVTGSIRLIDIPTVLAPLADSNAISADAVDAVLFAATQASRAAKRLGSEKAFLELAANPLPRTRPPPRRDAPPPPTQSSSSPRRASTVHAPPPPPRRTLDEEDEGDEEDEEDEDEEDEEDGDVVVALSMPSRPPPPRRRGAGGMGGGRRESLVYRPVARAAAFSDECEAVQEAVQIAQNAVEAEKAAWSRDLKRRESARQALVSAEDALRRSEADARAASVDASAAVSSALGSLRRAVFHARSLLTDVERSQVSAIETACNDALEAASKATGIVHSAARDAKERAKEKDALRAALRPVLERVAAVVATVEVGPARVANDTRVQRVVEEARFAVDRAAADAIGGPEPEGRSRSRSYSSVGVEDAGDEEGVDDERGLVGGGSLARAIAAVTKAEGVVSRARATEEARVVAMESSQASLAALAARLDEAETALELSAASDGAVLGAGWARAREDGVRALAEARAGVEGVGEHLATQDPESAASAVERVGAMVAEACEGAEALITRAKEEKQAALSARKAAKTAVDEATALADAVVAANAPLRAEASEMAMNAASATRALVHRREQLALGLSALLATSSTGPSPPPTSSPAAIFSSSLPSSGADLLSSLDRCIAAAQRASERAMAAVSSPGVSAALARAAAAGAVARVEAAEAVAAQTSEAVAASRKSQALRERMGDKLQRLEDELRSAALAAAKAADDAAALHSTPSTAESVLRRPAVLKRLERADGGHDWLLAAVTDAGAIAKQRRRERSRSRHMHQMIDESTIPIPATSRVVLDVPGYSPAHTPFSPWQAGDSSSSEATFSDQHSAAHESKSDGGGEGTAASPSSTPHHTSLPSALKKVNSAWVPASVRAAVESAAASLSHARIRLRAHAREAALSLASACGEGSLLPGSGSGSGDGTPSSSSSAQSSTTTQLTSATSSSSSTQDVDVERAVYQVQTAVDVATRAAKEAGTSVLEDARKAAQARELRGVMEEGWVLLGLADRTAAETAEEVRRDLQDGKILFDARPLAALDTAAKARTHAKEAMAKIAQKHQQSQKRPSSSGGHDEAEEEEEVEVEGGDREEGERRGGGVEEDEDEDLLPGLLDSLEHALVTTCEAQLSLWKERARSAVVSRAGRSREAATEGILKLLLPKIAAMAKESARRGVKRSKRAPIAPGEALTAELRRRGGATACSLDIAAKAIQSAPRTQSTKPLPNTPSPLRAPPTRELVPPSRIPPLLARESVHTLIAWADRKERREKYGDAATSSLHSTSPDSSSPLPPDISPPPLSPSRTERREDSVESEGGEMKMTAVQKARAEAELQAARHRTMMGLAAARSVGGIGNATLGVSFDLSRGHEPWSPAQRMDLSAASSTLGLTKSPPEHDDEDISTSKKPTKHVRKRTLLAERAARLDHEAGAEHEVETGEMISTNAALRAASSFGDLRRAKIGQATPSSHVLLASAPRRPSALDMSGISQVHDITATPSSEREKDSSEGGLDGVEERKLEGEGKGVKDVGRGVGGGGGGGGGKRRATAPAVRSRTRSRSKDTLEPVKRKSSVSSGQENGGVGLGSRTRERAIAREKRASLSKKRATTRTIGESESDAPRLIFPSHRKASSLSSSKKKHPQEHGTAILTEATPPPLAKAPAPTAAPVPRPVPVSTRVQPPSSTTTTSSSRRTRSKSQQLGRGRKRPTSSGGTSSGLARALAIAGRPTSSSISEEDSKEWLRDKKARKVDNDDVEESVVKRSVPLSSSSTTRIPRPSATPTMKKKTQRAPAPTPEARAAAEARRIAALMQGRGGK